MSHGRSIRIYLADGSAAGIRHAEVVNWTGQAIVCPRTRVAELKGWEEAQRPGVYLLVGDDPEGTRPLVYIGEAEHVLDRLKQHVADEKKDFWDQVVLFTSKDANLTKAHVKYLESRIVELVREIDRARLSNGNTPPRPSLPRADQDAMEEFLGPARLLLAALGLEEAAKACRTQAEGVRIYIGGESKIVPMEELSVVSASYEVDGLVVGTLGVIGPTRMAYDRMIQIVDITSKLVSNALSHK
jgi:hypothetical protein